MPDERRASVRGAVPARLVDLADLVGGESSRSRRFLGGLIIGALAGAAVAGAGLVNRRGGRHDASGPGPADPTGPDRS
jgi:hypothetical protein